MDSFLEKKFRLKEHNSDAKTEVLAGLTTFMTMAYILAVNPNILSATGMDKGALFTATALASALSCIIMAFYANLPFALAPGMGLNAYFAYTVVLGQGFSWQMALAAVFVEGIIFILLSLTNVREAIFNAIPMNLKTAVSVGIGLFIAMIGLVGAHILVPNSATLISLIDWTDQVAFPFQTYGISAVLGFVGLLITAILISKNVKGGILLGIFITYILGILAEVTGIYVVNPEAGFFSLIPNFSNGISIPDISPIFMKLDFSQIGSITFWGVLLSFLFVDIFDTLGTLVGVATKADMLDGDGKLPAIKQALLSDAVGTTAGACLGTSTVTTYVESASGVAAGGRTGLTTLTVGILFVLSLFFSPIFLAIPSFATAPALIIVGFYMVSSVTKINFEDFTEGIPAYITIFAMPFFYSIAEGISMGIISYVVLKVATGKTKDVTPLMYVLALIFVLRYIFG
ncbi:MAG: NCS2 family permease [Tissierellia bacterium]|nr:NCS2 family permease [Tissierellia bacterium]